MIDSNAMAPHISSDTTIPTITRKHKTIYHHHSAAAITMIMIKEALQKQEKHIAVDPLSLKHQESAATNNTIVPPPLQPPKSKFLSMSQPNSPINNNLRIQSSWLHKSKSCGEGRASDDFDHVWSVIKNDDSPNHNHQGNGGDDYFSTTKPDESVKESPKRSGSIMTTTGNNMDAAAAAAAAGKGFRCGCLYIPLLLGKAKTVRPKTEGGSNSSSTEDVGGGVVISRTVSMEKFECGSWAPPSPRAVVVDQVEGNDSVSSYFDLPSELIRDDAADVRGVLKKNGSGSGSGSGRGRKSVDASPRHVRFSTSPCITPRLRKARDEFNAFLEAHTAASS